MKYGIKAIVRTPLKTALFFLLIAAVTAFLSLGVGIWRGAEGMLDDADEIFKTAGEFVYTGGNYPDGSVHDETLQTAAAAFDRSLLTRPEVKAAEENYLMPAYVEDFAPRRADMPYGRTAVMIVTVNYPMDMLDMPDIFNVFIENVLYSPGGHMGMAMLMYQPEGMTLQRGQSYVVVGRIVTIKGHNYNGLQVMSPEELGYTDAPFPFIAEVDSVLDEGPFWDGEAGAFYRDVVEKLRILNSSSDVIATHDVTAVSEFHRGEFTLKSGSFFTEEHHQSGTYCIVPERFARRFNVSVGDTVDLSVLPQTAGTGRFMGYDPSGGFAGVSAYTIIGIYDAEAPTTPVYIPAAGQPWLYHSDADYVLARVTLHSRHAASFLAALEGALPDGVRFDYNDQGYAAAVRSIMSVRATALMITGVCVPACLLVLWFFGFFFVFRSRETARILLILGTRPGGIVRFFLAGSGLITLFAAAAGTVSGYFVTERIFHTLFTAAEEATGRDARFSISGFGIKSGEYTPALGETSILWPILTAAAVLLVALAVCLCFAGLLIRSQNPRVLFRRREKRGRKHDRGSAPKRPAGARLSAALPTVTLRYGVRSILRGGKRSLTVPVLFAALLLFLALYTSVRDGYQGQLATVYDDIPVTLRVSDISGRKLDNLVFEKTALNFMKETGFAAEIWGSANFRSERNMVRTAVDDWNEIAVLELASWSYGMSSYQVETFLNQMQSTTDPLIVTEDISRAPEFYFVGLPDAEFIDGLDWDYFTGEAEYEYMDKTAEWYGITYEFSEIVQPSRACYILVSRAWLDAYGLALGDHIILSIVSPNERSWNFTCQIAGVLDTYGSRKTVYAFHPDINTFVEGDTVTVVEHYGRNSIVSIKHGQWDSNGETFGAWFIYVTDHYTGQEKFYSPWNWRLRIDVNNAFSDEESAKHAADLLQSFLFNDFGDEPMEVTSSYVQSVPVLNAGGALLQNTENLSAFKDWLSERYDQLGKGGVNRRWVVIDDDTLYTTIENLSRYIGYMDMLYPVIFALIAAMGFLISNLLLKSRAAEIGILRGVGTPRPGVFFALFCEQVLLSLPGLLAGICLPLLMFTEIGTAAVQNAGLFSACYFTGAAIAILHTFRDKAIKNLARKEE
ncbi:MAG: hypothetical protein LBI19_06780, partial [Oscillospiraceae bacterium]|jgi:ABC-type lipoprotein release transport system permease subunit|nr:hypothetical protein [Oscillospiraceae bacterium]